MRSVDVIAKLMTHPKKDIPKGTVRSIERQSGVSLK